MTCDDICNAARAERANHPLRSGRDKLEEARQEIAAWRELVLTVTARLRTGGNFRTDENLGPCMAQERGTYLKGLPARLARLIGYKILPGIAALSGDGVPPAEVECLLRRAETDAHHLIADCKSLQLRLKGGIGREYQAMRKGEGGLIRLLEVADNMLDLASRPFQPQC